MSAEGTEIIRKAKDKYLGVFSEIVRNANGDDAFEKIIQRIGRIMLLLPAAEVWYTIVSGMFRLRLLTKLFLERETFFLLVPKAVVDGEYSYPIWSFKRVNHHW